MIKIILSIIAVLLIFFFIVTSFASGFVRGLKLMSIRNVKQSPLEQKLLKQFFKQNQDVDPFLYSLYMKDAIKEKTDVIKKTIQEKITGKWMNKRSKKVWVVDESKSYDGFVVVVNNKISRSIAKNSFLKNWKKYNG